MRVLIFLLCLFSIFNNIAYGHPGKLDSNNGHTCYTNCSQYGLKNGQYHYHSGNEGYSGPLGNTRSIKVEQEKNWSFGKIIFIFILFLMVLGCIMMGLEKLSSKSKTKKSKIKKDDFSIKD